MTTSRSVHLYIGNALPHGNAVQTGKIINLWKNLQAFFRQQDFIAPGPGRTDVIRYVIQMDASVLIGTMERAVQESGSFDDYLQAHVLDESKTVSGSLIVNVSSPATALGEYEAYEITTLFLHQLVIAVNLVQPGAIQILHANFTGKGAYLYEAQCFDSRIYYGALRSIGDEGSFRFDPLAIDTVWNWLVNTEVSHTHVAIRQINKVLFSMLKVAQQRNEYSARTVLLVLFQLEVLLDCRNRMDASWLRRRAGMVLGNIPEAADCFHELCQVRDGLFIGSQPVLRPDLIAHNSKEEFREQIGQHNTAVERGTALVLVLLRKLIMQQAQSYVFTESYTCT
jgi:hypothetical protein